MNSIVKVVQELKPLLLMMLVQVAYTGNTVIASLAITDGMSIRVFSAYRHIFGAFITFILALIFERKNRPKLTLRVLVMTFLCGLFGGSLFQNLFFTAIALVSATYANAIFNMVPVVTFILSFLCGYEKLNLRTVVGKAKVMGTIIGVNGTMMLSFYKGIQINIWKNIHINLIHKKDNGQKGESDGKVWIGVLSGIGCCFSFSVWLIIQAKLSKEYPSHHSSTSLMNSMAAVQATVFALCVEKDWNQWKLPSAIRILAALYSGIAVTTFVNIVTSWCVRKRGPLYASVFNPLTLVLVAATAPLLLQEKLYLGSVLGATLIVCGLYMVLWSKSKEMKPQTDLESSETELSTTTEVVIVSTNDNDNSDHVSNNR
ncbi:WAT1-related protein At1g68170-like [Vigna radiata var. radiata]|uniref:WAT1-related protein n=1 Tax=Vigna radiata var. radiata TaxID=3916 RepID=A0A1S3T8G9_VIGRR|nr:WAT1-related protein At1g68170-like [Vigna radiata var. radiata]